jgi:hypothetical protein
LYIFGNDIELFALLTYDVGYISEQLVQLSDALLNVPNLGLALND